MLSWASLGQGVFIDLQHEAFVQLHFFKIIKVIFYLSFSIEFFFVTGCEVNQCNISEDFALPPPKQFRDLDSPSSSVTNSTNDEEINAVDNLLYHVVDTQTTLERKPSQFNKKLSSNETEGKLVPNSDSCYIPIGHHFPKTECSNLDCNVFEFTQRHLKKGFILHITRNLN